MTDTLTIRYEHLNTDTGRPAKRVGPGASMTIPLSQPDITQREIDAVVDVLHTPHAVDRPEGRGVRSALSPSSPAGGTAIGVSSGTAGLHCAMIAAGIGPGDEVITTPFSFVASANCILYVGAKPVFVDIDPKTLNMDVDKVEAAITPQDQGDRRRRSLRPSRRDDRARADRPAARADADRRLPAKASAARRHAPTTGRSAPSAGPASSAFYPNKQITTGEGGMIVTDDDTFAAVCRALRNQGREGMAWLAHQRLGYNYRLSEINAAIGVAQMRAARRNPRQPPPRRPSVHRAADDQPLPDPADAAGRRRT